MNSLKSFSHLRCKRAKWTGVHGKTLLKQTIKTVDKTLLTDPQEKIFLKKGQNWIPERKINVEKHSDRIGTGLKEMEHFDY